MAERAKAAWANAADRPRSGSSVSSRGWLFRVVVAAGILGLGTVHAQSTQAGPYLAHLLAGGPTLDKPLPKELAGTVARTEEVWVRTDTPEANTLIAGIGDPNSSSCYFELQQGHPGIGSASGASLLATATLSAEAWHLLTLSDDGQTMTLYIDGVVAGTAHSPKAELTPQIQLAPDPGADSVRFSGDIGGFSVTEGARSAAQIAHDFATPPNFDAQLREENAKPWPVETKQQLGYRAPQDPDMMPHGAAPEPPHAEAVPADPPTLKKTRSGAWEVANNWELYSNAEQTLLPEDGAIISQPSLLTSSGDAKWLPAIVDRKSTRLNSSHQHRSRMPSSA